MTQETLDNANKYEMQHLAYINVLSDLHRSYQNHKDEEVTFKNSDGETTGKAPKEIKLVYPFKESLVNQLSGEYDSQTAYYSSSLITIFRMLSDELPWLSFSLNSVKEKVYDTKAEATETSREVEENGDTVTFKNSDGETTGKAPKEIKLVYPFKESLVNQLSGEYDSQTAYYSSSLITIFRMLSDELPWLSFSLNSVKEKVYDTKAEATETSREVEENGDTVVSYSKPFREIPTINLEARFNNSNYDEQAIKRVLKDFKE